MRTAMLRPAARSGAAQRRASWAVAFALVAGLVAAVPVTASAGVGMRAHSFAGFGAEASGGAITGQKPESKLWYHDGSWWAAMISPARNGAHTIHRLSGNTWTDTGVIIDPRPATKEDVLSLDSGQLYIVSRGNSSIGDSQLRRFTYSNGVYALDSGFPVAVPGRAGPATTLARDTTGRLWITYIQSRSVRVARASGQVPVAPGSVIFTKSGGMHGIENPGDVPLRFVAFLHHTS
jgi:hypothetical protein